MLCARNTAKLPRFSFTILGNRIESAQVSNLFKIHSWEMADLGFQPRHLDPCVASHMQLNVIIHPRYVGYLCWLFLTTKRCKLKWAVDVALRNEKRVHKKGCNTLAAGTPLVYTWYSVLNLGEGGLKQDRLQCSPTLCWPLWGTWGWAGPWRY